MDLKSAAACATHLRYLPYIEAYRSEQFRHLGDVAWHEKLKTVVRHRSLRLSTWTMPGQRSLAERSW